MLIGCPSCATHFSVPDKALQPKGRTLKCAKCGHKWFQGPAMPEMAPEDAFSLDLDSTPEPRPSFDFNPVRNPDPDMEFETPTPVVSASAARAQADFDIDLDDNPPDVPVMTSANRTSERPMDVDLDGLEPQPIPAMFASKDGGKKGTGGLWFLLLLLLLGGLGGAGYLFQDKLVGYVPQAAELLDQVGLRREKPGAGLELRNAGTPERFVHNDTEVLIVRGIIANVSDRVRPVPTMKLVLLDKTKNPVQEKLSQPRVTQLDPGGTSSFQIILERPDPTAVEVNVLFVDAAEAAGK
ncbi:MAG: zinc-ribbon domain-containing protein [Magnetospirillum gryphiswaldense]|nr:zinc-ribbon domain-containing protein [Magnetospirillum gryphiswaldense]